MARKKGSPPKTDAERAALYRQRKQQRAAAAAIIWRPSDQPPSVRTYSPRQIGFVVPGREYLIQLSHSEADALALELFRSVARSIVAGIAGPKQMKMTEAPISPPVYGLFLSGLRLVLAAGDHAIVADVNRAIADELARELAKEAAIGEPIIASRPTRVSTGTVYTGETLPASLALPPAGEARP